MWRGEKIEYLRSNRDYAELLGDDHGDGRRSRSSVASEARAARMQSKGVSQDRQEYLDRRQKLKELERQKMKQKTGRGSDYFIEEEIVPNRNKESNDGGRMDPGQSHSRPKTRPLPYDRSFGSFFGPSEPIVARRIIEEARAREEAEMVAARARETEEAERQIAGKPHSGHSVGANSKSAYFKARGYVEEPKVAKPIEEATTLKAKKLKEARDYSFLFSDSDMAGPASESKPSVFSKQGTATTHRSSDEQIKQVTRSSPLSRKLQENSKSRANQVFRKMEASKSQSNMPKKQAAVPDRTLKLRPPSSLPPKPKLISVPSSVINPGVIKSKTEIKPKPPMVPTSSKRVPASRELPKKVMDSGRPSNSLPSSRSPERRNMVSAKTVEGNKSKSMNRQGLAMAARADTVTVQKALPANIHKPSSGSGDKGRRVLQDGLKKPELKSNSERAMEKSAPAKSSQSRMPERSAPVKHNQSRRPDVSKKRRAKDLSDESEDSFLVEDEEDGAGGGYSGVSDYIRRMFGYNPNKYRDVDDGDDRDMEVGFNRIQAEERRSARIAREEDEREAQLLEEEERAERARKLKKLKMGKK